MTTVDETTSQAAVSAPAAAGGSPSQTAGAVPAAVDPIPSQAASTAPAGLEAEVAHLAIKAAELDNGQMSGEQLLNQLVADDRIARLLAQLTQANHGDQYNASQSQGLVTNPTGSVTQFFINGNIDANAFINFIRSANIPIPPAAAPPAAPQNKTVEQYRQQIHEACKAPPKYNFPQTFQFISAAGVPIEPVASLPVERLIEQIDLTGLTLLRGSAGMGKSTLISQIVERLTREAQGSIVPILLQIRELSEEGAAQIDQALTDDVEPERYIESLLSCSPILLSTDLLKQLSDWVTSIDGGRLLVIADGLNEVYGEDTANAILKRLTSFAIKRSLNTRILVTDRTTPRDALTPQWKVARLELLTQDVVHQQFQAKGIDAIYSDLGSSDQTLLQTPYFLEYALDHNTARLSSPTEALSGFFSKRLELDANALDRLANAAYSVYADHHSYQFDVDHFVDIVGLDTFNTLENEGVIVRISTEGKPDAEAGDAAKQRAQFDHPLKHDYLAAKYLSEHDDEWNPVALDALSFESNSFDALSMTLELIDKQERADRFVERVHNWNWAAAFVCIAKAMRYGSGRHSQEMQMAVLALVVEKIFDPVQQTRERATGVLAMFPPDTAAPYKQLGDLKDLCALVYQQVAAESQFKDRELWFPRWRDLFIRFDNPTFGEIDLQNIVDTKSIIGWTAANVFKRFKLSDVDVRQLHAYYDACSACDPRDWLASTIRWRVVHALGATDTQPVAELLSKALDGDRYMWARIGAARSLVEIAALTANAELRQQIVKGLIARVEQADEQTMAAKTLREIGQSAFYRGAASGWEQAVTPLIEVVCKKVDPSEQEWWSNLLAQFKLFCHPESATPPADAGPVAAAPATQTIAQAA